MVVLPYLLAVCALGADSPDSPPKPAPPRVEIAYDVRYGFVDPSWRGSSWFRSLKEIGRQGQITIWTADASVTDAVLRLEVGGENRTAPEPALVVSSWIGAQARIEQPRRVPQAIVIQRMKSAAPTGAAAGSSPSPSSSPAAPAITSYDAGETEVGYRALVTSQSQAGRWRIQLRVEETHLRAAVSVVEGLPDPAFSAASVVNCLVSRPEREKQTIQGEWTVPALTQAAGSPPHRLIISLGARPAREDLRVNPFRSRMEEAILILAPRLKEQSPLADRFPAPSSFGALSMRRTQDPELERVKAEAAPPLVLEGPKIIGSPVGVLSVSPALSSAPIVKSYVVADLVPRGGLTAVARKVFEKVSPGSWRTQSRMEVAGTITPLPVSNTLIIRQTPQVHREIEEKLRLWRKMRGEGMALETIFPAVSGP